MEQKMIDLKITMAADGTFSYTATKFEIWGATTDLGNGKGFSMPYGAKAAAEKRYNISA